MLALGYVAIGSIVDIATSTNGVSAALVIAGIAAGLSLYALLAAFGGSNAQRRNHLLSASGTLLRAQTRHGGGQMATRALAAHQAVVNELRVTRGLSVLGIEVTSQAASMLLLGWAAALAAAVQIGAAAAAGDASAGASVD